MEGNMQEIGGKEIAHTGRSCRSIEGSLSAEEGEELEKVVFPACGEIFNQSRYKVTVCAFVAQKPTQEVGEEKGTSVEELSDEEELEVERVPNVEVRECDQLQSQP